MTDDSIIQRALCDKYGAVFVPAPSSQKVGIALNVRRGLQPINGLRHLPAADTTGWYIWAGEQLSAEADFFHPLHVKHLPDWNSDIVRYLGLAPGWRFLITPTSEDVWFDPSLLNARG